jgi:hypothetical protein
MRRMADSVTPANLPPGMDLYGGYDDGDFNNVNAIRARFPGKTVIAFTVNPAHNLGDCLDVERGDATPTQAPGWVKLRRGSGHPGPLVYCSEANRQAVLNAFAQQGVAAPPLFIAAYPGSGAVLQHPADAGHQFIDHGPWDESVVIDYLPGIDPAVPTPKPQPVPPPTVDPRGDKMLHTITIPTDSNGNGYVKTTIPWGTFEAVSIGGSDPALTADAAYWPGSVLVQDRDGMVLVEVKGARNLVNVTTFVLATA